MKDTVILVTKQVLGTTLPADAKFGMGMLDKFFCTLESQAERPSAVCFYTEGVKLLVEGSPVLPSLQLLERLGVRLMICESCLAYYGLEDQVAVGEIGGTADIVRLIAEAQKVVTV